MGIVYKGLDPDIEREVAIKTIRVDTGTDGGKKEELLTRIIREAKAAGRLNHPNIITIYDVVREKDLTYIVMQYVDGQSLQGLIDSGKPLLRREIFDILRPISLALDYAHQNGIVHRDIKPANILIDKGGQPLLADFGVARIETSTQTQAGTRVGTLSYMSPEQVKGETVDNRSDIFSLGVVLYELLTGKRPFEGENISTIVYKIVHSAPQRISDFNKDLPPGDDPVIQKALAKKPQDRYQTCREMMADLEKPSRTGPQTLTLDTGPAKPEAAAGGKRKKRLALGAAALGLIVVIGGLYLILSPQANNPAGPSADKTGLAKESPSPVPNSGGPGAEALPSFEEDMAKLRASFDGKNYDQAVKLAEDILGRKPGESAALEYLRKAKAELLAAQIASLLQSGTAAFRSGNYNRCGLDMERVLKLDKDNKEARKYLFLADEIMAEADIRKLIESNRQAEETKDLSTVLSHLGSPALAGQMQTDYQVLFNGYDNIKYIISKVAITYEGRWNATASFSYLMIAVYKKDGKRKSFEGTKIWQLRKQGGAWKIIDLR